MNRAGTGKTANWVNHDYLRMNCQERIFRVMLEKGREKGCQTPVTGSFTKQGRRSKGPAWVGGEKGPLCKIPATEQRYSEQGLQSNGEVIKRQIIGAESEKKKSRVDLVKDRIPTANLQIRVWAQKK